MRSHTVEIAEGDALVIPARFRQELGLEVGESVMLDIADGELRVRSRHAVVANAQKLMRTLVPVGVSLTDELIQDRRADAARDES